MYKMAGYFNVEKKRLLSHRKKIETSEIIWYLFLHCNCKGSWLDRKMQKRTFFCLMIVINFHVHNSQQRYHTTCIHSSNSKQLHWRTLTLKDQLTDNKLYDVKNELKTMSCKKIHCHSCHVAFWTMKTVSIF